MTQITGADLAGDATTTDDIPKTPKRGLHHCSYYDNLVKYNPAFCGKCPHNGFRPRVDDGSNSNTCF